MRRVSINLADDIDAIETREGKVIYDPFNNSVFLWGNMYIYTKLRKFKVKCKLSGSGK